MHVQPVARVYAQALLDIARDRKQIDAIGTELVEFAALVSGDGEIRNFLVTPVLDPATQSQTLARALEGQVQPVLVDFLCLLIDKGRIGLLGEVAGAYQELADEVARRQRVQAHSAQPLDGQMQERLRDLLRRQLQRECVLETAVQPDLLGGLTLTIGDTFYDGSLRTRLQRLRHAMMRSSGYEN